MKRHLCLLTVTTFMMTACFPTSIITVSPSNTAHPVYSTVVTTPRTGVRTTTSCAVTPVTTDISLYLDLQAVGAAFAQSSSIQEFESLLNNTSYIISNLDLNGDGFVDYLRVLEQVQGYNHVFVIQAVLGNNIFQDVATLVAEVPSVNSYYVQIIGAPYIYGPNYIIRPIYMSRPPIFSCFHHPGYICWRSPWYWDHFPNYYRHPVPIHISHYQAYVNTYMCNHRYCHEFEYASSCHYAEYGRVSKDLCRQDYEKQHPEKSFVTRTASIAPAGTNSSVTNARDIRDRQRSATTTSTTPSATSSVSASSRTSATSSARSASSSSRTNATPSNRSASPSSSTSTTVQSSVRNSGTSSTRTTTVSPSGATSTYNRGSATTSSRSSSSSSRGSATTTSTSNSRTSATTSSNRSSATTSSRSSSSSSRSSATSSSRSSR